MQGSNIFIKKGAVFAYRLYDIAHEINLQKAQALLESQSTVANIRRYQLNKDPLRTVAIREAPLTLSGGEETIAIKLKDGKSRDLKALLEVKIWGYGVLSFSYRIDLPPDVNWKDLVLLGSILDSDSVIDELSVKKREEITSRIGESLKNPYTHTVFEDYTTYLIEDLEEHVTSSKKEGDQEVEVVTKNKIKDPLDLLKRNLVPELLLAEPNRPLSDSTRKSIQANYSQYTKKDLLLLDWNSALVIDFTKEKDYQDYIDIIEFSMAQLLELRIYDQLLDEKLDQLYESVEDRQYKQITDFYNSMTEESSRLYMEFSDFFEKLDNSIKTVGDFYLAKVLKTADKRFGFEELKKTMSRKIDALREISTMYQDKIDSLVDTERNQISEHHTKVTHRMELIVIFLIAIEVIPTVYKHMGDVMNFLKESWTWLSNLF